MNEYIYKLDNFLFPLISNIERPNILELGVQQGISTVKFLQICNKNDGFLFSVDVEDYSKITNDKKWKFIKSRDDNFEYIKSLIPKKIDVLYIDSLHEAKHVQNIIYNYYDIIKVGGYLFIDDISHLPYLDKKKTSFYCEINNKETFEMLLSIFYFNQNSFDINFSFKSSGLCIIKKKSDDSLKKNEPLKSRKNSLKNILRKTWMKFKK